MIVYHGTSWKNWLNIKKRGLRVRGESKKSNWTHSIESNPDTIYLTDAYAVYFGLSALTLKGADTKVVVIEMDTDDLPGKLVPDEDALEQVSRASGQDGLPEYWSMQERTRYYRGMTQQYAEHGLDFQWSMETLGTGGHIGNIPPSSFRRVAIFDPKEEKELSFAFMDTQVSVLNYRFLGPHWRNLTQRVFGGVPEPVEDVLSAAYPHTPLHGNIKIINLQEV